MSVVNDDQTRSLSSRFSPRLIIALVSAVLAVTFVLQNSSRGSAKFLFFELTAPAWLWFVGLFLSGVVVGSVFPWFGRSPGRGTGS